MATIQDYNATAQLYKRRKNGSKVPLQSNIGMNLGAPVLNPVVPKAGLLKLDSAQIYGKKIIGRSGGLEFATVVIGFYVSDEEEGVWKLELVYCRKTLFNENSLPQFVTKAQVSKVIGCVEPENKVIHRNPFTLGMNEEEIRACLFPSHQLPQTQFSQLRLTA